MTPLNPQLVEVQSFEKEMKKSSDKVKQSQRLVLNLLKRRSWKLHERLCRSTGTECLFSSLLQSITQGGFSEKYIRSLFDSLDIYTLDVVGRGGGGGGGGFFSECQYSDSPRRRATSMVSCERRWRTSRRHSSSCDSRRLNLCASKRPLICSLPNHSYPACRWWRWDDGVVHCVGVH